MCEKRMSNPLHPGHALITSDTINIKLHPNINMENEIVSSRPRKPVIHSLKEWRNPPHEDRKQ